MQPSTIFPFLPAFESTKEEAGIEPYPFCVKMTSKNGALKEGIEFNSNIKTVSKLRENPSPESNQMSSIKSNFGVSKTDIINNNYPVYCADIALNSHKGNHDQRNSTKIKQVMQENETILYQTISYQLSQTIAKFDNCIKKSFVLINQLRNEDEKSKLFSANQSTLKEITELAQNYQDIVNDAFRTHNQRNNSYFNFMHPKNDQDTINPSASIESSNVAITNDNNSEPTPSLISCMNKKKSIRDNHLSMVSHSKSETHVINHGSTVYCPPSKRRRISEISDFPKFPSKHSIQFSSMCSSVMSSNVCNMDTKINSKMKERDSVEEKKQVLPNLRQNNSNSDVSQNYNIDNEHIPVLESFGKYKHNTNKDIVNNECSDENEDGDVHNVSNSRLDQGIKDISRHCTQLSLSDDVQKFAGKCPLYIFVLLEPNFAHDPSQPNYSGN